MKAINNMERLLWLWTVTLLAYFLVCIKYAEQKLIFLFIFGVWTGCMIMLLLSSFKKQKGGEQNENG